MVQRLAALLVASVLVACAGGEANEEPADLATEDGLDREADEDVADGPEDEAGEVSFSFPLYLTGLGPSCDAPIDTPWCHFSNVDDLPGDRLIIGETECQAQRPGPLSHVGVGYQVSLLDASGSIVAVAAIEERPEFERGVGRTNWDPDGKQACRIEVEFVDVPESPFYTLRSEHGEVDAALQELLDRDEDRRVPSLLISAD